MNSQRNNRLFTIRSGARHRRRDAAADRSPLRAQGLEERVQAKLKADLQASRRAAPPQARVLRWPGAPRLNSAWMRTAAAAAIVLVVAGGVGVSTRESGPPGMSLCRRVPCRAASPAPGPCARRRRSMGRWWPSGGQGGHQERNTGWAGGRSSRQNRSGAHAAGKVAHLALFFPRHRLPGFVVCPTLPQAVRLRQKRSCGQGVLTGPPLPA